ncbi:Uncharacterised protein [Klebsiella pneumoniae]|nr:Uncharacterised protein [Klebsiella pneumoniae]
MGQNKAPFSLLRFHDANNGVKFNILWGGIWTKKV